MDFRETHNQEEFEALLKKQGYPFTQGFAYGAWHEAMGKKVFRFVGYERQEPVALFQAIRFELPLDKHFLYVPHGPVISQDAPDGTMKAWYARATELLRNQQALFLRFDVSPPERESLLDPIRSRFLAVPKAGYASSSVQPKYEWEIDVAGRSEEELLAKMHPKARYNIELARRKGVRIEIIDTDLERFASVLYGLLKETAQRQGFHLHPEGYYRHILAYASRMKNAFLVLAYEGEMPIAAHLVVVFGKTATYMHGGSSHEHRQLMAPVLAHFEGMKEAHRRGYAAYNLGGVSHNGWYRRWQGITTFKQRLGGRLVSHGILRDIVGKPFWYMLYMLQRKLRSL